MRRKALNALSEAPPPKERDLGRVVSLLEARRVALVSGSNLSEPFKVEDRIVTLLAQALT
jgi:hypothetical protein